MTLELLVEGLEPEDAGRGIVRLSGASMEELGVDVGDIVMLTGRRKTVGKAFPAYADDPDTTTRIDGNIRANAGVGINDRVKVDRIETKPAEEVTVALPPYLILRGAEPYIRRGLASRPVLRGDSVRMGLLGRPLVFVVTGTKPTGPVIVGEETEIVLREKPITDEDLRGERTDIPDVTYDDVGGLDRELSLIREMIELPLRHPELFRKLGIAPPRGVLLHGPPGTGKTLIAKAVANEVDATFIPVSGPEIMSKYYGESEQHLREVFEQAAESAPAIIFIDELDSIAPSREQVTGEVERRVVAQLLSLMDGLEDRGDVIVIAATNRVNAIDPALRRGGRFDREIEIGVPDRNGRLEMLQIHTRGMPLAEDVDLNDVADHTHGYVGADLESLVKEAAMSALRRIRPELDLDAETIPVAVLDRMRVTMDDFHHALANTEPSAMREVLVEIPDVTYGDVGGLETVKQELVRAIEWPLLYPNTFEKINAHPARGLLLYGPPGTGKTLLAKAVANASAVNFISVKGPELLDKYVGESERAVREVFQRARQNAPTIVFLDEIDAIAPQRGASIDSHVTERVVSQFLTELDGIEDLGNVVVLGATNRPDMVDPAILRSGRLEKLVYVPIPDADARREIFVVHTREMPLADGVSIESLVERTEGYTGSDIEAVVREASMLAMAGFIDTVPDRTPEEVEAMDADIDVSNDHFAAALERTKPTVSDEQRSYYETLSEELGGRIPESSDLPIGFE